MMVSSEDMKDLLAEFVPQQETVSFPENGNAPPEPESRSGGEAFRESMRILSVVRKPSNRLFCEMHASAQTPEVRSIGALIFRGDVRIPGGTENTRCP